MKKYSSVQTDVFTDKIFAGNQLAVFLDGKGLDKDTMQAMANEMNYSESTFILPPESDEADFRVRIFTPGMEVPIAGHPTIGTTFVLASKGMIELKEPVTRLKLEMLVGIVPVEITVEDKKIKNIMMTQPIPVFEKEFTNVSKMAKALSIAEKDIAETRLPMELISMGGLPFFYVPISSLAAVQKIKANISILDEIFQETEDRLVFVFVKEPVHPTSTVHCRMFGHAFGVIEDAATGAASGPLGYYLVKHKVVEQEPIAKIVSEQGFEMGRPSIIKIEIDNQQGEITGVRVGGNAVIAGEGFLYI